MLLATLLCIVCVAGIDAKVSKGRHDDKHQRNHILKDFARGYKTHHKHDKRHHVEGEVLASKSSSSSVHKRNFADWYYGGNCPDDFIRTPSGCCIELGSLCDRYEDCDDGYDERLEVCRNYECGEGKMRCEEGERAGACFHKQQLCDRIDHCGGGYDEDRERCINTPCNEGEYKCELGHLGRCLPRYHFCDGFRHCGLVYDNRGRVVSWDENVTLCMELPCHLESQYMCPEGSGNPGKCLYRHDLCDGRDDCGGEADEVLETCLATPCEEGYTPCGDGTCYLDLFECNESKDCPNGADEDPDLCGYK